MKGVSIRYGILQIPLKSENDYAKIHLNKSAKADTERRTIV